MKRFIVLLALLVILIIGWTVGWFLIAGRLEAEIRTFETADGTTTPRLTCGTLGISGFPFQFHPACTDAHIVSGDMVVDLARLDATALFYRPTHIQFFADSPARLTDAFTGTVQEVSWQTLRGSLRLEGDRIGRISLVASQIAWADALLGSTVFATADDLEMHIVGASAAETPTAGDVLDLFVSASGADIHAVALANASLALDARLTGLPPLASLSSPAALRLWQANGGALTLRSLEASADGVRLDAHGETRLDAGGLLNGTVTLATQGVAQRLAPFTDPALVELLLGAPDASGRATQTLSASEGTIRAGIIPFTAVPALF